jgi:hypothetical protein
MNLLPTSYVRDLGARKAGSRFESYDRQTRTMRL